MTIEAPKNTLPLAKQLVQAYIQANPSKFPLAVRKYPIKYYIEYKDPLFCHCFDFSFIHSGPKKVPPRLYHSLDPQLLNISVKQALAQIKKEGIRNERNFRRRLRAAQKRQEQEELQNLKELAEKWGFILTAKEEEK